MADRLEILKPGSEPISTRFLKTLFMQLDRLERHTAYIIMLAELELLKERGYYGFLCHIIAELLDEPYSFGSALLSDMLPELLSKRPNNYYYSWFASDDYDSRIKILKQCINETY